MYYLGFDSQSKLYMILGKGWRFLKGRNGLLQTNFNHKANICKQVEQTETKCKSSVARKQEIIHLDLLRYKSLTFIMLKTAKLIVKIMIVIVSVFRYMYLI